MNRFVLLLCVALAVAPSPSSRASADAKDPLAPVTTGNTAERSFSAIVSAYARGTFAFDPGFATSWGIHAYDDKLEDRSRAAIDREIARAKATLAKAKAIRAAQLSDSARIDYDFFLSQVGGHVFDLPEIRRWE